jgi:hypothetical protein
VLTSAVGSASKRSLIVMFTVSGQVPCSGAQRQDKGLEVVSTAILGGAVAMNVKISGAAFCVRWIFFVGRSSILHHLI